MNHLTLEGSYEAMGAAHGQLLKYAGVNLPPVETFDPAGLLPACLEIASREAPELIREARALAETAGIPEESLLALLLTAPLGQTLPTCSVVAVTPERSASDRTLIGRNYDFTYTEARSTATSYAIRPLGARASLGNADIMIGREDGVNEAGLFVGMSASFLPGAKPGLAFWFIVRLLLDRCATVREALETIQSLTHAQSRNYLLADQNGDAIVVEATLEGCHLRHPEHGVLATTNHVLSEPIQGRETFIPETSPARYAKLAALADLPGKINLSQVKAALKDRESGLRAHGQVFGQPFGTIWSLAAELDGNPCFEIAEVFPEGDVIYDMLQWETC